MTTYTVAGYLLHDCPLSALQKEAEAGRSLKRDHEAGRFVVSSFAKLDAIEQELFRRRAFT